MSCLGSGRRTVTTFLRFNGWSFNTESSWVLWNGRGTGKILAHKGIFGLLHHLLATWNITETLKALSKDEEKVNQALKDFPSSPSIPKDSRGLGTPEPRQDMDITETLKALSGSGDWR